MIHPVATRTITLGFETEEQARRFDAAMTCQTAIVPWTSASTPTYLAIPDDKLDAALAIEHLATRAVNGRPFSGRGDPDAFPPKVEIVEYDGA